MTISEIKAFATELRRNPTPSEKILWEYLRKKQLDGRKFLRQHPIILYAIKDHIAFYIPDFYCAKEKLVVELDGKIHLKMKERDNERDRILQDYGFKVLRIKNEELEDIDKVLGKIRSCFRK